MSGGNNVWGNLYNALAYLTPNTRAYKTLFDSEAGVYWNTAYYNIDTSNTTAGGVVIWADNCYSVDVTYSATGTNPFSGKTEDYAKDAVMRIYFLNSGNGFYISDFEII